MTPAWERLRKEVRRPGIFHFALVIALACFVAPDHARAQGCAGVPTSTTGAVVWTPQWCDEFNAATAGPPSTTTWNFDLGNGNGWGNNELEVYCGPPGYTNNPPQCPTSFGPATSNAYVNGTGHLVIQAINSGGTWTSARLNTNTSPTPATFQYGRFEASEKLPVGAGLWPAFWALGSNFATVAWPTCGEMDFMENVLGPQGLAPALIRSTLHGGISPTNCYCGAKGLGQNYTFPSGVDVTSFHAYGAIWSPNMVQFYVDNPNNVFFIVTASDVPAGFQWAFNQPFIVITNLAVGGSYAGPPKSSTPNPAVMLVDYVRYYHAAAVPAPKLSTLSGMTVNAGSTTDNTNSISLSSSSGAGRVYLQCATNAPKTACFINTGNTLNSNVADFSASSTGTAIVIVATTAHSMLPPLVFSPKLRLWTPVTAAVLVILLLALTGLHGRGGLRRWTRALALAGLLMAGVIAVSCGSASGTGTPAGSYTVTVNAYTETGNGSSPDATVTFDLTVN